MKILIVEDEPSLRELMARSLQQERYVVETASTYRQGVNKALGYDYDCILLDIMLPDGDGLDLLQKLKEREKNENVIIISAKDSWEDKVKGLDWGADDYLAKPFHLAELSARIKSVLRRKQHGGAREIVWGNVRLQLDSFQAYVGEKEVKLNRKEYDILLYFVQRPRRLVNKAVLAEAVWGDGIAEVDNFDFIYAQMKNLRRKLSAAGASVELKAVYGVGYKLVELSQEDETESAQ